MLGLAARWNRAADVVEPAATGLDIQSGRKPPEEVVAINGFLPGVRDHCPASAPLLCQNRLALMGLFDQVAGIALGSDDVKWELAMPRIAKLLRGHGKVTSVEIGNRRFACPENFFAVVKPVKMAACRVRIKEKIRLIGNDHLVMWTQEVSEKIARLVDESEVDKIHF